MPVSDGEFQAALTSLIGRLEVAVPLAAKQGAALIQARGMAKTRVKQGTLRRSWRAEFMGGGSVSSAKIGPTTVYARRIELGFDNMRDSLGRIYHQKPKPYVKPTYVESVPVVRSAVVTIIGNALRR